MLRIRIESALVLVLLRWPSEVRGLDTLALTKSATDASLSKSEMEMAKRLVSDMAGEWTPEEYRDRFHDKVMELVETKAREGEIENVETGMDESERKTADIIDLTELLKRSLRGSESSKSSKAEAKPKIAKKSSKTTATKENPEPVTPKPSSKTKAKAESSETSGAGKKSRKTAR